MSAVVPEELEWEVHGLRIAGQGWGDPQNTPLLALHGWLDNAASFSVLAPLLQNYRVVALDLTGHGRSDHRSADATYQIWDDLPEIHGVVEQLGWDQFALIGHSRGAIISTLLASTSPQRVSHLVLLDAVTPQPLAESEFVTQLRKFILDKHRLLSRPNRVFGSSPEAVTARRERGLGMEAAHLLAARNLKDCEGGVTWGTDPRLYGASAAKLTEGQVRTVLQSLLMPVLIILAEEGLGAVSGLADQAGRMVKNVTTEIVSGGHHFHMEDGVQGLAERIEQFLQEPGGGEN